MKKRKDLEKLQEKLDIFFNNEGLLRQALTHRSYINENPSEEVDHNERLEFLGDAVLELAVTEHLYLNYSNPEGELTSWRASLVNTQAMAEVSDGLEINDFLFLSKGESKDIGRARQSILANSLEAIIGAIYLDKGYEAARAFIEKHILKQLPAIIEQKLYQDPKSLFQEAAQEKTGITPTYRVISEAGPDHFKNFRVGVYLEEQIIAEGKGSSKQEAEQEAAQEALKKKGW